MHMASLCQTLQRLLSALSQVAKVLSHLDPAHLHHSCPCASPCLTRLLAIPRHTGRHASFSFSKSWLPLDPCLELIHPFNKTHMESLL